MSRVPIVGVVMRRGFLRVFMFVVPVLMITVIVVMFALPLSVVALDLIVPGIRLVLMHMGIMIVLPGLIPGRRYGPRRFDNFRKNGLEFGIINPTLAEIL